MNPNININDSVIDFAYLTICFKEFLDKSQLVLNDLEKKIAILIILIYMKLLSKIITIINLII